MSQGSVFGCGLFGEAEWAAIIVHDDVTTGSPELAEHIGHCGLCKAEYDAFTSLGAALGRVASQKRPSRQAFIGRVLAAVDEKTGRRGASVGAVKPAKWRGRIAALATTAVITVFVLLGSVVIPWLQWPSMSARSTGEVLPGGTIAKATDRTTTVGAAALHADGVVAAVAGTVATGEPDDTGRTIRVTSGMHAAATTSVAPLGEQDE